MILAGYPSLNRGSGPLLAALLLDTTPLNASMKMISSHPFIIKGITPSVPPPYAAMDWPIGRCSTPTVRPVKYVTKRIVLREDLNTRPPAAKSEFCLYRIKERVDSHYN